MQIRPPAIIDTASAHTVNNGIGLRIVAGARRCHPFGARMADGNSKFSRLPRCGRKKAIAAMVLLPKWAGNPSPIRYTK